MNINQLQYFQVTSKYENISRASQELHVSQSAISKAIKELEKEFEISLFNRYNNSIFLTPEGKNFLETVNSILNNVSELYASARDLTNRNNSIKIGMSPLIGSCLLPPFYQELLDYDPNLILDFTELSTLKILEEIENENIDIGLIVYNDINMSRLGHVHLLDISLMFCTNIINPLAKKTAISFNMLEDEPLVLLTPDSIENRLLMERFAKASVIPNILLCSEQVYTIQHFVNHELASSFLYDIVVPRNSEVKLVPLDEPIILRAGLIWKKERYLHSSVKELIRISKGFTFCHYHG